MEKNKRQAFLMAEFVRDPFNKDLEQRLRQEFGIGDVAINDLRKGGGLLYSSEASKTNAAKLQQKQQQFDNQARVDRHNLLSVLKLKNRTG